MIPHRPVATGGCTHRDIRPPSSSYLRLLPHVATIERKAPLRQGTKKPRPVGQHRNGALVRIAERTQNQ
jgi:hypothetical protein